MILSLKQIFKSIQCICILIFCYELLDIIWIKTINFYLFNNIYIMILCINNIIFFNFLSKIIYENKLNSVWDILENNKINILYVIQIFLCCIIMCSWGLITIDTFQDKHMSYKNIFDIIVMSTINILSLFFLTLLIYCVLYGLNFNIQIQSQQQNNQKLSIITIY